MDIVQILSLAGRTPPAYRLPSIVTMRFSTNSSGAPALAGQSIVGRPVRILVAVTATTLSLLIGWAIYDGWLHKSGSTALPPPVVASTRVAHASPIANSLPAASPRVQPGAATPADPRVAKEALATPAGESPPSVVSATPTPRAEMGSASLTITELKLAAAAGDATASVELGVRYLNGRGVTRDYTLASEYFRVAGTNPRALKNLGWMYALGQGMRRDDAKAVELFRSAAAQNYPNAEDSLGFAYEHGRGVSTDREAAKEWYRRAAAQGFEKSIANLAALEKHQ